MAATERLQAVRLHPVDQPGRLVGLQALVPVVVAHHHHRRLVARAEALHRHDREQARGIGLAALDAERVLQLLDHALGAGQRARQRGAHLQHELPHRRAVEHHVVGDDVLDLRRRAADHLGDVPRGVGGDVALLLLCQVERMQHRGLALLGRVMRRELLELRAVLRRELELRTFRQGDPLRAVPLVRAVGHGGMKAHRSTSPMTTSSEPMTAMTSAIIPPTMNLCSAWQAIRLGARMCTRHGRLLPSDTT